VVLLYQEGEGFLIGQMEAMHQLAGDLEGLAAASLAGNARITLGEVGCGSAGGGETGGQGVTSRGFPNRLVLFPRAGAWGWAVGRVEAGGGVDQQLRLGSGDGVQFRDRGAAAVPVLLAAGVAVSRRTGCEHVAAATAGFDQRSVPRFVRAGLGEFLV